RRTALALERVEPSQRVLPEDAGPVRGTGGRGVERGHGVLARRPALELIDDVVRDFFRRNELHLSQGGDGGELVASEQAVLADVDVGAVERLARLPPAGRPRPERRGARQPRRAGDQRNRPALAAP